MMRIFFGLNITSRVAISKVILTIQPFDPKQDVLGLLSDADARDYVPSPVKSKCIGSGCTSTIIYGGRVYRMEQCVKLSWL